MQGMTVPPLPVANFPNSIYVDKSMAITAFVHSFSHMFLVADVEFLTFKIQTPPASYPEQHPISWVASGLWNFKKGFCIPEKAFLKLQSPDATTCMCLEPNRALPRGMDCCMNSKK